MIKDGQVVTDALRVDVSTNFGVHAVHLRRGQTVRLLVRMNRPAYFYVVGHVVRESEQFSYVLPLYDGPAGEFRAERFTRLVPGDQANHLIDLGEFEVQPPFGLEHLIVTASTASLIDHLPKARYDAATNYFIIDGSRGNVARAVELTRGLQPKVSSKVMVTEGTLSFTTSDR